MLIRFIANLQWRGTHSDCLLTINLGFFKMHFETITIADPIVLLFAFSILLKGYFSYEKRGQISEDVLSGSAHSAKARVIFCLEWPVVHMPVYREN